MESPGNIARIEGFKANVATNGKTVVLLQIVGSFQALLSDAAPIDPAMILGGDLRESSQLMTLRDWVPEALLKRDAKSQVPASVDGVQVTITKRVDTPGNPFVQFEFVKV